MFAAFRQYRLPTITLLAGVAIGFWVRPTASDPDALAADREGFGARSSGAQAVVDGEVHTDGDKELLVQYADSLDLAALAIMTQGGLNVPKAQVFLANIGRLSGDDLSHLLRDFDAGIFGSSASLAYFFIISALIEKDPQLALEVLDNLEPAHHPMFTMLMYTAWSESDGEGALAYASGLEDSTARQAAIGALIQTLASSDPALAVSILRDEVGMSYDNIWRYNYIYANWARQDPAAARADIEANMRGELRRNAYGGYFVALALVDAAKATAEAFAIEDEQVREASTGMALAHWFARDPAAALNFLGQIEDAHLRNNVVQHLSFDQLAEHVDEGTLEWVRTHTSGNAQSRLISGIIGSVAKNDPQRASALLAEVPFGRTYSNAVAHVALSWAHSDPEAVYSWASSLDAGQDRTRAIETSLRVYADTHPEEAFEFVLTSVGEGQAAHIETLAQNLGRISSERAYTIVSQIEDEALYESGLSGLIKGWAQNAPLEAIRFLEENGRDDMILSLSGDLARHYGRHEPESAAHWAMALGDGKARLDAVRNVTRDWIENDSLAASVWIGDLPRGEVKDVAVGNLINSIRREEPQAALIWSFEIENDRERTNSSQRIFDQFAQDDREAAISTVRQSGLSDTEKANLIKRLGN